MTSRRDFLAMLTAASGAFIAPKGMYAALSPDRKLRIGVLSDVHITEVDGELWKWKKALKHFRDVKVDCVVVAGDLANLGLVVELESFAKAWFEVFPNDKRPDGEKVERVFVMGNHDQSDWGHRKKPEYAVKDESGNPKVDKDGNYVIDEESYRAKHIYWTKETLWPRLFGEPYTPFFARNVKGYWFLGSHWRNGGMGGKHDYEAVELPGYLKEHEAELKGNKPFFFVQHLHPKRTCHGGDAWWPDCGRNTTDVLSAFPNAVCFSGHSHKPLTDERAVWQGGFTSFGTCSLSYSSSLGGGVFSAAVPPNGGKRIGRDNCNAGYVIDVHDGFLAVRRMEFSKMNPLGDDWIVPVPVNPAAPEFAFASRAAAKKPPAYAKMPEVKFEDVKVTKNDGTVVDMLQISFPAVPQGDKSFSRVYAYEITMRKKDGTGAFVRTVRSAACDNAISLEPDRVCWNINPEFQYVKECDFDIVPIDCFRNRAKRKCPLIAVFGGSSSCSLEATPAKKVWQKTFGADVDTFSMVDEGVASVDKAQNAFSRLREVTKHGKAHNVYVLWCEASDLDAPWKKFRDGVSRFINQARKASPSAAIVVFAPVYSPLDAARCAKAPKQLEMLKQYVAKMEGKYLDLGAACGFTAENASKYFTDAGVLNKKGYEALTSVQIDFLRREAFKLS